MLRFASLRGVSGNMLESEWNGGKRELQGGARSQEALESPPEVTRSYGYRCGPSLSPHTGLTPEERAPAASTQSMSSSALGFTPKGEVSVMTHAPLHPRPFRTISSSISRCLKKDWRENTLTGVLLNELNPVLVYYLFSEGVSILA